MAFRAQEFAKIFHSVGDPASSSLGEPKHSFSFWVNFVQPNTAGESPYSTIDGISFKVLSFDRPRFTLKNETLNAYNKKRVIYTGVEYQPIAIRFADTKDERVISFIRDYMTFHFGDFTKNSSMDWYADEISEAFHYGGSDWGYYNWNSASPDAAKFLEKIELYTFDAGKYSRWDIVNPKIVSVSPDTYDLTSPGALMGLTIEVAYEGVIWPEFYQNVDNSLTSKIKHNLSNEFTYDYTQVDSDNDVNRASAPQSGLSNYLMFDVNSDGGVLSTLESISEDFVTNALRSIFSSTLTSTNSSQLFDFGTSVIQDLSTSTSLSSAVSTALAAVETAGGSFLNLSTDILSDIGTAIDSSVSGLIDTLFSGEATSSNAASKRKLLSNSIIESYEDAQYTLSAAIAAMDNVSALPMYIEQEVNVLRGFMNLSFERNVNTYDQMGNTVKRINGSLLKISNYLETTYNNSKSSKTDIDNKLRLFGIRDKALRDRLTRAVIIYGINLFTDEGISQLFTVINSNLEKITQVGRTKEITNAEYQVNLRLLQNKTKK